MFKDLYSAYRDAFKVWLRRRTRSVSVYEAQEKRLFWAKSYSVCAIAAGIICTCVSGITKVKLKTSGDIPSEEAVMEEVASEDVKVVKFQGFKKVHEYIFKNKVTEEKEDSKIAVSG